MNQSYALLSLFMMSSILLGLVIGGVALILKYKEVRARQTLLAAITFLIHAGGIMAMLASSAFSQSVSAPFDKIMDPSVLSGVYVSAYFMMGYLIEAKRPGSFTFVRSLIYIIPVLALTICLLIFKSMALKIAVMMSFYVYCVPCALLTPATDGSCIMNRWAMHLGDAMLFLSSITFILCLNMGVVWVTPVHVCILLTLDLVMAYTELVTRGRRKPEVKESEKSFDVDESVWKSPAMTADKLARRLKISREDLTELLQRGGYDSYADMVNIKRVEYICKRLSESGSAAPNITDLMFEAGYRSRSTASAAFKNIMGCSPTEYLNRNLQD